ncbi:hypothetical protein LTR15_006560 [Elasticomyces elasticus]|nr:hypothetical protein LTR15_006560 [Elasticomyces elasticus]
MHLLPLLTLLATATAAALPLEKRTETCSTASASTLAAAKAAFTQAKLAPDLVPSFDPTLSVQANFNGKQVALGNSFSATETLTEPAVSFSAEPGFDPSKTKYTIILTDPDAPGPAAPILKDFLHLIISDAQPSCIASQARKTLASYQPLTPLSIAAHRYAFLVYRQPPNYTPSPSVNYLPGVRAAFDLNGYVAQGGLTLVGGNFMREGLSSTVCAITPGCTQDGKGYSA